MMLFSPIGNHGVMRFTAINLSLNIDSEEQLAGSGQSWHTLWLTETYLIHKVDQALAVVL